MISSCVEAVIQLILNYFVDFYWFSDPKDLCKETIQIRLEIEGKKVSKRGCWETPIHFENVSRNKLDKNMENGASQSNQETPGLVQLGVFPLRTFTYLG